MWAELNYLGNVNGEVVVVSRCAQVSGAMFPGGGEGFCVICSSGNHKTRPQTQRQMRHPNKALFFSRVLSE